MSSNFSTQDLENNSKSGPAEGDGSIGSGQRVLASQYVGPTAKAYDWSSGACY